MLDIFLHLEALNAILEFSNTVVELLSRRKLKREVLLKYLFQEVSIKYMKCSYKFLLKYLFQEVSIKYMSRSYKIMGLRFKG